MKYIAKITVGRFDVGEEVTGLSDKRADELLAMGAIEQIGEPSNQAPPQGEDEQPQSEPLQDEQAPPQGEAKPKKPKVKPT